MRPTPTLRGEVLARYAKEWLLFLQDIFDFVREPTVALRASVLIDRGIPEVSSRAMRFCTLVALDS